MSSNNQYQVNMNKMNNINLPQNSLNQMNQINQMNLVFLNNNIANSPKITTKQKDNP